jgi:hypothetical protein
VAVGDPARSAGVWRLIRQLDRRAVGRGAAGYLAVAVPCGLVIAAIKGSDAAGQESNLWILAAVVVLLVAPMVGGALAGRARPDAPLAHGAAAVVIPAGVFLVARALVGLVQGNLTAAQVVSFLLFLQVFAGLAVFGAYVASRRSAP